MVLRSGGRCYNVDAMKTILVKTLPLAAVALCAGALNAFECSPSARARARDFIDNEKQFHLGFLPTEQSNPITATLEEDFKRSTLAGVQCLQRGDRQIPITMRHVFAGE